MTVENFFGGGALVLTVDVGMRTVRRPRRVTAHQGGASGVARSFAVTQRPPGVDNSRRRQGGTLLPPTGGSLDVYGGVSEAITCRYTVAPAVAGFPLTVPCSNGSAMATVTLPANTATTGKNYTVTVTAQRSGSPSASRSIVPGVASVNETVADFSVSGYRPVDPKFVGEAIPYTLTVTNAGPDAAPASTCMPSCRVGTSSSPTRVPELRDRGGSLRKPLARDRRRAAP